MLALLTGACVSNAQQAPVTTVEIDARPLETPKTTYSGRTTIVESGDNLYSISFVAGFNFVDIAAWNEMDPEETIYPGQEIKLYPPEGSPAAGNPITTRTVPTPVETTTSTESAGQSTPIISSQSGPSDWMWPTRGTIIQRFSKTNLQNGIQITGESGTPIHAASKGTVVYSGTGLIGYGRIIIVKHNQRFLSVYAHNSRVVVNEGDSVEQGQKIAEMGSTDTDRVKLHFEIRRDGSPVDPLRYLPAG